VGLGVLFRVGAAVGAVVGVGVGPGLDTVFEPPLHETASVGGFPPVSLDAFMSERVSAPDEPVAPTHLSVTVISVTVVLVFEALSHSPFGLPETSSKKALS
jgi:hypothetical protein